jgi:glycosyltransferase involved in cell wall biosynthesis
MQQCLELAKYCDLKVVAPLPWSPLVYAPAWMGGERLPERETIDGIDVYHPRYFMTPKVGRMFYGYFFYLSLLENIREIYKSFHFDVIYAPWVFPDGVGSQLIARDMGKPIIIGALGTDINSYMNYFLRRKIIARSLAGSEGVIAVSRALKNKMVENGVPDDKISVITNGVDNEVFKPLDKEQCRKTLGITSSGKAILFVGNLVRGKGIEDLVDAFSGMSERIGDSRLMIIGDGPLKNSLKRRIDKAGLKGKVNFTGKQRHDSIPLWMNACDVFCLPSHNEGCPNVVLEAMACGAPIVATNVGGIPELIVPGIDGELVPAREPKALSAAIESVLNRSKEPKDRTTPPRVQNWFENAGQVYEILKSASLR